jgi:hypothetical protein
MDTKQFDDSERIRANYCRQSIRHMLIYRFSMEELRKIARKQGMPYKRHTAKYDRHIDEFTWFEDRIYNAMNEQIRDSIIKYELRLFMPCDSINITKEDDRNWVEFEKIIYRIVK